jgi:hypothetical protein
MGEPKAHWEVGKDIYVLSCGHPLYMNKSYSKLEPGAEMYCFRCMEQATVNYPQLVILTSTMTALGQPARPAPDYWWRCTTERCRKGKPQAVGVSQPAAVSAASKHVAGQPSHRVHVVSPAGIVLHAFGNDTESFLESALPF